MAGVVGQAQTTKQVKKKKEQHLQKMHASARELCKMAYFLFSKLHDKTLYGPASSSGLFSPSSASPSRRRAIRCAMPRAACRVCACACAVAQYSFLWSWITIACAGSCPCPAQKSSAFAGESPSGPLPPPLRSPSGFCEHPTSVSAHLPTTSSLHS